MPNAAKISFESGDVRRILFKYGVKSLNLFGSAVRGEDNPGSDIDLLVSFARPISLLQLVALERELTKALGRKVDIVTIESISP